MNALETHRPAHTYCTLACVAHPEKADLVLDAFKRVNDTHGDTMASFAE